MVQDGPEEITPEIPPEPVPEPVPEPAAEQVAEAAAAEETSDLGSPGFNDSQPPASEILPQPVDNSTTYPEVSHDVSHGLYQPASNGLSYPQGVTEVMPASTDYFQPQPASSGSSYPHHLHQPSNVAYQDTISETPQQVPQQVPHEVPQQVSVPEPVQAVLPQPIRPPSSHSTARRTLPSGSSQNYTGYPTTGDAGPTTASWQSTNVTADATQPYSTSPTLNQSVPARKSRSRNTAVPAVYEAPQQESLGAATALSQAALQSSHPSPTARTVSPFQNSMQAARAESRQGQRQQGRPRVSPFPQSSAQPTAIDAPAVYSSSAATNSNSLPSFDQYTRYNTASNQASQPSTKVPYKPYSQQTATSSNSTSYSNYDAYNSRPQGSSISSPLLNPVTQSMSSSYTKTAAPESNSWSNTANSRTHNSYSSNRAPASSDSAYNVPATAGQQQPANVQSFNVRPHSTIPQIARSSTNTPNSYTQQPRHQQQQSYSSYSSRPHNTSSQQPPQQQPQPQQWYGLGSANNTTSSYGPGSYGQHRGPNPAGSSYDGQEALYEMLRSNPRH